MTTNPYINNFANVPQQTLAADIIEEAIQFYGYDVIYCPRTNLNYDDVTGESTNVAFNTSFPIEMYIKSIDGYGGEGQFFSNIGIEIRSQVLFTVSIRRWEQVWAGVTSTETRERPKEGDLIYYGLDNKLMEIKKVNRYTMFYQMGTLYTYDLTCEVFEYTGEQLNTGYPAIDQIGTDLSINTNEQGSVVGGQPVFDPSFDFLNKFSDNKQTDAAANSWIDFSEDDRFSNNF